MKGLDIHNPFLCKYFKKDANFIWATFIFPPEKFRILKKKGRKKSIKKDFSWNIIFFACVFFLFSIPPDYPPSPPSSSPTLPLKTPTCRGFDEEGLENIWGGGRNPKAEFFFNFLCKLWCFHKIPLTIRTFLVYFLDCLGGPGLFWEGRGYTLSPVLGQSRMGNTE